MIIQVTSWTAPCHSPCKYPECAMHADLCSQMCYRVQHQYNNHYRDALSVIYNRTSDLPTFLAFVMYKLNKYKTQMYRLPPKLKTEMWRLSSPSRTLQLLNSSRNSLPPTLINSFLGSHQETRISSICSHHVLTVVSSMARSTPTAVNDDGVAVNDLYRHSTPRGI
jgi:hypothetical protein